MPSVAHKSGFFHHPQVFGDCLPRNGCCDSQPLDGHRSVTAEFKDILQKCFITQRGEKRCRPSCLGDFEFLTRSHYLGYPAAGLNERRSFYLTRSFPGALNWEFSPPVCIQTDFQPSESCSTLRYLPTLVDCYLNRHARRSINATLPKDPFAYSNAISKSETCPVVQKYFIVSHAMETSPFPQFGRL
jgi:hypothetical protein